MTVHRVGTREEWLAARKELLEGEKELTRRSDEVAQQRQQLPWVLVDKEYRFETSEGTKTLPELFGGRSQLFTYHFMFGPSVGGWPEAGCPGCSYTADSLDGAVVHLEHRDVTFVAVSHAPIERLEAYKRRMGWSFPWVSFGENEFNLDFALYTEEERRTGQGFNFGSSDENVHETEVHGLSAFAVDGAQVFHTYSTFDRGTDVLNATWQLLDRAPKGRGEEFEDWPRRHDEY